MLTQILIIMKKLFFCINVLLISTVLSAQVVITCLPEGITFSNQAQIDNFQINYPCCNGIVGDVIISGGDITNLNGLSVLNSFYGSLRIGYWGIENPSMTNLSGLDNVTSIGGNLEIYNNDALASLTGLDNVTSIGGWLNISGNDALTNLTGLDNVTFIEGWLSVRANDALTSLTGLDNLTSIGESLKFN